MHSNILKIPAVLKIDWQSLFFGSENGSFLPEVAVRSFVMFLTILVALRILGKRSVTQLSVFELGVIIGLGSAAGDPMFYKDVGLLPAAVVFTMVVSLTRFMTYLININSKIENILEGQPVYLIEEGRFNVANFEKEPVAQDEFFAQLRQHNVTHLGQVQWAIIETNGAISLVFYPDEKVSWGLPVLPHLCEEIQTDLQRGNWACKHCGETEEIETPVTEHPCSNCAKNKWLKALCEKRIS